MCGIYGVLNFDQPEQPRNSFSLAGGVSQLTRMEGQLISDPQRLSKQCTKHL